MQRWNPLLLSLLDWKVREEAKSVNGYAYGIIIYSVWCTRTYDVIRRRTSDRRAGSLELQNVAAAPLFFPAAVTSSLSRVFPGWHEFVAQNAATSFCSLEFPSEKMRYFSLENTSRHVSFSTLFFTFLIILSILAFYYIRVHFAEKESCQCGNPDWICWELRVARGGGDWWQRFTSLIL